ncbi:Maf family protein [Bacillus sp. Marseille-P3661]|uniref:Maf family protein n=1 Tax=Bacillus sp. Marseille-P3661 TaxID=1936234 RepID=UPI000C82EF92|nr:Maf family protein [Bacillus sp. Marseille-P3661]
MKKLILASGSPRRKELLEKANIPFEIIISKVDETFDPNEGPDEIVKSLALQKAEDVSKHQPEDAVVLGADTIVTFEDQILGKPKDKDEAKKMLQLLSGKEHVVYTGVAIVTKGNRSAFYEPTKVTFWELEESEIDQYIESGEPFDKAGAYGIQGLGALLVKRIEGDYFSVVGLPISRTVRELKKFMN